MAAEKALRRALWKRKADDVQLILGCKRPSFAMIAVAFLEGGPPKRDRAISTLLRDRTDFALPFGQVCGKVVGLD